VIVALSSDSGRITGKNEAACAEVTELTSCLPTIREETWSSIVSGETTPNVNASRSVLKRALAPKWLDRLNESLAS
jgi:hypothetical protein